MIRYMVIALMALALTLPGALHAADFTVTFTADGNGSIYGSTTQSVASGGWTAPVTALPSTDYHFVSWTGDNGFRSYQNPLSLSNVTASLRVTAMFAPNRFDVITHGLAYIRDFKAGAYHTVVLKKDGSVVAKGGTDGQSDVNGATGVRLIGAGPYHTLLLKTDGSIVAKGAWLDQHDASRSTPVTVPAELINFAAVHGGVAAFTGGYSHSVALANDGAVFAWGDNTFSQTDVPSFAGRKAVAVATGHFHTVALLDDNSVIAWGRNFEGELAPTADDLAAVDLTGVTVTQLGPNAFLTSGAGFSKIDAKAYHTVALTGGKVVCWGDNEKGQGNVPAAALSGVTAIAAGGHHTVAIAEGGRIVSWGDDAYGQGTVPPGLTGITGIAAGSFFTMAKRGDLALVGWGLNSSNQCDIPASAYLPVSTGTAICTPTTVGSAANFTTVCTMTPGDGAVLASFLVNGIDRLANVSNGTITILGIDAFQSITAIFATPPAAPVMGGALSVDGNAVVSFSPPLSDNGSPITHYTVTSAPDGITATGQSSPITVSGLSYGKLYTFMVTATNVAGTGPPSAPSNPLGMAKVTLGNLSATYDGSPKSPTAATVPADLAVQMSYNGSPTAPTNAGSYTVTAQIRDLLYQGSATGTMTIGKADQAITVTTPAPAAAGFGSSFTVLATAPGGPVSYGSSGGCSNVGATFTMTSATEACGVSYDQGGGVNYSAAPQLRSSTTASAVVPGAPQIVKVTAINGEATITFTPPSFDGGSPITGYTATANPGSVTATGTGNPITVSGLNNGTAYTFSLSARNAAGAGSPAVSEQVIPLPNGDLNGDGVVDIQDALLALRLSVGLANPNPGHFIRGDVAPLMSNRPNPDGKVDIGDVIIILRRSVGALFW